MDTRLEARLLGTTEADMASPGLRPSSTSSARLVLLLSRLEGSRCLRWCRHPSKTVPQEKHFRYRGVDRRMMKEEPRCRGRWEVARNDQPHGRRWRCLEARAVRGVRGAAVNVLHQCGWCGRTWRGPSSLAREWYRCTVRQLHDHILG